MILSARLKITSTPPMQLTQLMQQSSATTQRNSYHLTKRTHISKRPCFLYAFSFLEMSICFTTEQPSTSQILLILLPKLSKLFSLHSTVTTSGSQIGCYLPKLQCMANVFQINFCNMIQCTLHCSGGHGNVGLAPSGDHCSIRHHRATCPDFTLISLLSSLLTLRSGVSL